MDTTKILLLPKRKLTLLSEFITIFWKIKSVHLIKIWIYIKKWYDLSPEEKKNYAKPDTPRRKIGEEAYKWKTEIAYDMAMIDYYNKLYSSGKKPRANDKTYYF